jgi:hypothetical protein
VISEAIWKFIAFWKGLSNKKLSSMDRCVIPVNRSHAPANTSKLAAERQTQMEKGVLKRLGVENERPKTYKSKS